MLSMQIDYLTLHEYKRQQNGETSEINAPAWKKCKKKWEIALGRGERARRRPLHPGRGEAGLPAVCHSAADWGGGVGGKVGEGSQCLPARGCPGSGAPSLAPPAPSDHRTAGRSAARSSSSIAECCRRPCSRRTSQRCPWRGRQMEWEAEET